MFKYSFLCTRTLLRKLRHFKIIVNFYVKFHYMFTNQKINHFLDSSNIIKYNISE